MSIIFLYQECFADKIGSVDDSFKTSRSGKSDLDMEGPEVEYVEVKMEEATSSFDDVQDSLHGRTQKVTSIDVLGEFGL